MSNLNIVLVFAYIYNVANFRVARYRKFGNPGNTKAMTKNKCLIRIQQLKITIYKQVLLTSHIYPKNPIF